LNVSRGFLKKTLFLALGIFRRQKSAHYGKLGATLVPVHGDADVDVSTGLNSCVRPSIVRNKWCSIFDS
jgi:hypothetical protein